MTLAEKDKKEISLNVYLRNTDSHPKQREFIESKAKRKVVRAGRRGGKTVGAATLGARTFLNEKRVLYAAPTQEQVGKFWFEVKRAFVDMIDAGYFKKNESEMFIEREGTEQRIKCKTAWNADMLRGDYADLLILDEFQLMDEDTWEVVGAPMLADKDGDAVFIYTPPSLRQAGVNKTRNPRHAVNMWQKALHDKTGEWAAFHFTSHDNPYISKRALSRLIGDMTKQSYRQEILAEDDNVQLSWLVFGKFNELTNRIPRRELNIEWPRYVFHDFGMSNPAAVVVTCNPYTGDFYVEHEYFPGAGHTIEEHVKNLKLLTEDYKVNRRMGGSHQEDEIRQAYRAYGWPIYEPNDNHQASQIAKLLDVVNDGRLYVFEDCVNLLEEMMNALWEIDDDGRPSGSKIKDTAKYHLVHCLMYGFTYFKPMNVFRLVDTVIQDISPGSDGKTMRGRWSHSRRN